MTEPTATFTVEGRKPLLIEDWLPIREIGIESVREAAPIPGQFPKLKTLHVWWARSPLAASAGVVLASVLPAWNAELLNNVDGLDDAISEVRSARVDLQARSESMSDRDWYHAWVQWLCGVWGDPVQAMSLAQANNTSPSFAWKQAYKNRPTLANLKVLHSLLKWQWGRIPRFADPTAGGGSLPYTAIKYGLPTWANDLNPVAATIQEASLELPARFGPDLSNDVERWGRALLAQCEKRLAPYFPIEDSSERVTGYLYANAVECPRTG